MATAEWMLHVGHGAMAPTRGCGHRPAPRRGQNQSVMTLMQGRRTVGSTSSHHLPYAAAPFSNNESALNGMPCCTLPNAPTPHPGLLQAQR